VEAKELLKGILSSSCFHHFLCLNEIHRTLPRISVHREQLFIGSWVTVDHFDSHDLSVQVKVLAGIGD
jgi:hypothetical protein